MSEIIAYHEAGHALVAYLLGGEVRQVTIEPEDDDGPRRGGDTQVIWRRRQKDAREFAVKSVQVHLAGPVAEMIYTGEPYHPAFIAEWAADWQGASAAVALLHRDEAKQLLHLEAAALSLHRQLQQEEMWMALAALADLLLAHETLEWEQVDDLLQELIG